MQSAGIDGPNGWVLKNKVFDNGYYEELIGGHDAENDSTDIMINDAPPWHRQFQASNGNGFPDQRFWRGTPNNVDIVMVCLQLLCLAHALFLLLLLTCYLSSVDVEQLNSDIALVRQLDSSNMDASIGRVSCTFTSATSSPPDVIVCPHVSGALRTAARFKADNLKWLNSFQVVLERMLTHGYSVPSSCQDATCQLAVKR